MLASIFKNRKLTAKRLGITVDSVNGWLKGSNINLTRFTEIYEIFGINPTVMYVNEFFSILTYHELSRNTEETIRLIHKTEYLDEEDRIFLKSFYTKKLIRNNTKINKTFM